MKMRLFLPIFIIFSQLTSATIINIPADYPTIQHGISASSYGDTVLVQPGTYIENIDFNGSKITLGSLFLTTGDTSYIEQTIIDGDSAGSVVVFENGEDSSTTITGFTIQRGENLDYAAGINCYNSSNPRISYNYIRGNNGDRGSGIDCRENSSPYVYKNIIEDNYGIWGSGVYCYYSSPIITDNIIRNNSSGDYGIIFSYNGLPVISNNIIIANVVDDEYSGMIHIEYGSAVIFNNVINNNSSQGIYCQYADSSIIFNNSISENTRGITCFRSPSSIIHNNTISRNSDVGIYCSSHLNVDSPVIFGNNINGNARGGIFCYFASSPIIINNTINGNTNIHGSGFGVKCEFTSYPIIVNTILWSNSVNTFREIISDTIPAPLVSYSNIQDTLWPGEGNISIDPLFRDSANGDLHLMSTECGDPDDSPCIDSGSPHIGDSLLDCSWGLGTIASDMGAYGGGDTLMVSTIVINVPGDYPTIQQAIDASSNGDTVLVQAETYYENINLNGHNYRVHLVHHYRRRRRGACHHYR
jgi:parallel beta-helix repeat protein